MTYVSRKIRTRRPAYVGEVAEVLEEEVVALVEIDCLRPPLDTLVVTPRRLLATTYAEVRETGSGIFDVPLAEVASFVLEGRRRQLTLHRTGGEALWLGNLVDPDVDLDVLLATARSRVAPPVAAAATAAPSDLDAQLAQLERIAAMQAAGTLTDEQADQMRRKVIDQP